ncbi:hypothetical protein PV11_00791 [Exophiala sideris]|uniref:Enoyl reductase (ER) domain-containing protein n=1 Tax=Exophiala sideris TaxID=1016849 RepID=A0A0D1W8K5_9EURO|nr:hypothetical protein PV11_00791 [Exophiala sideris]
MTTTTRVATRDGIEWHCERQGQGPHLMLIPSGEGDCSNFAKVASLLASDFTITTFDMPGMSRSTAPEEALGDVTATKIANQVIGLMDELAIDTTIVYGCSSGGLVALSLAASYPERIQSAVVHEVPLSAKLRMFTGKTDDEIVDTCRQLFADVMVEDREAWLALGTEYHGRLDRNYLTWVHRYVNRVERSFTGDELTRRPIHWTVGELSPMGLYFENVVAACGAGIPIGLLPCRHFPQVTIPDTLAEHIRVAGKNWKHLDYGLVANGCLIGCDFAGTIVEVGKGVEKNLSVGDRVAGVAHGGNGVQPEDGAFAEYIVTKGDILIKLPNTLSFEEAATLPLGVATVMHGLYQKGLKLRLPDEPDTEKPFVLIYGGATATGALGIQYARMSGYTVVTTCSPQNFEYVKSIVASDAFNYKDAGVGARMRELTNDGLKLAWDIIANEDSAKVCAAALSSDSTDCRYASFLSQRCPREDVESVGTNMYTVWGEYFKSGSLEYPANQADFGWAKRFMELTEKILAAGSLKAHKVAIKSGGLHGVLQGLDDMKRNKVSAEKLVYRVAETV